MKTALLLAALATGALATGAMAQSTGQPAGSTTTTTSPSPSTGSNTGSGSTTGNSASATPGNQSPNPSIGGDGQAPWPQSGAPWTGNQPMLQGMMTCVSPAPMGGFGSFACYPAGWGGMMASGMNGWHPHMRHGSWREDYGPNQYYEDRQSYDRGHDRRQYDYDWRGSSGGYADDGPQGDYSRQ